MELFVSNYIVNLIYHLFSSIFCYFGIGSGFIFLLESILCIAFTSILFLFRASFHLFYLFARAFVLRARGQLCNAGEQSNYALILLVANPKFWSRLDSRLPKFLFRATCFLDEPCHVCPHPRSVSCPRMGWPSPFWGQCNSDVSLVFVYASPWVDRCRPIHPLILPGWPLSQLHRTLSRLLCCAILD